MRVFLSHGHRELPRLKLKEFLTARLGVEVITLAEQPDLGMTIVEKLEHYGRACDFALIMLTGDDLTAENRRRARQNVVHELGFFASPSLCVD